MDTINFTRGVPANESFPTTDLIDSASAVFKTHGTAMLQYGPSRGFEPLRQWLAEWQGVAVDRVMTSNGSLQLIEFLCLQMLKPGDLVFTESPSYDRTINLLRRHGAKVVGIPLEADGPNIEALERALQKAVPKFFYVIPDFQNPAGATCSGAKRRQLAALAEKYNFLLVEDAPYRMLRYRGKEEPTLYSLAPQRTLHMSSFTKLIAPGRAYRLHDRRAVNHRRPGQGGRGHIHLARLRGAGDHLRVVPARAAAAADREAQGALRAASRCDAGGSRQVPCPTRPRRGPTAASSSR